ncbi:MAG: hypothetical protein V4819_03100 [Verrucomicrobiota bacterium]
MKLNHKTLVAGAALMLAFIAGRYLLPDPTSGFTGLPAETVEAVQAWKRAGVDDTELAPRKDMRRRIDRLHTAPSRVSSAVNQALLLGDPVEQNQRITDYITKVDASNWKAVVEQFRQITRQTGRTHEHLWRIMMLRVGQVAGEEAINDNLARGGPLEDRILVGWAMADPAAARAWWESTGKTDEKTDPRLLQFLTGGMAVNDPAQTREFLSNLSEADKLSCVESVIWNTLQRNGLDSANAWLDHELANPTSTEVTRRTFDEVAKNALRTGVGKQGPDPIADWFQRYGTSQYVSANHVASAADQYKGEASVRGLDFLLNVADLPAVREQAGNPPGLSSVIKRAYQGDPGGLESWLLANPSAPFRNRAIQSYADQLESHGDSARGAEWRAKISR